MVIGCMSRVTTYVQNKLRFKTRKFKCKQVVKYEKKRLLVKKRRAPLNSSLALRVKMLKTVLDLRLDFGKGYQIFFQI